MASDLLEAMVQAALAAGEAIMAVYARPFGADQKADGSPVTDADRRAEATIRKSLAPFGLPILGEEGVAAGDIPPLGTRFLAVDPLDGTKEFIKRNGEFTVNIALVEDGRPVVGVVLAPALARLYAANGTGAWTAAVAGGAISARQGLQVATDGAIDVVASRSHGHAALGQLMSALGARDDVSLGSSLKFCLLAEGKARLYPRLTPTCEWDTAAGQAVLEAAGGIVLGIDGAPLRYGKRSGKFLNPFFVAASDRALAERTAEKMRELV